MSATRVPSYPRSAKTSAAARSSRSRVSVAVTPAMRPMTELKERSSDSSRAGRPRDLLAPAPAGGPSLSGPSVIGLANQGRWTTGVLRSYTEGQWRAPAGEGAPLRAAGTGAEGARSASDGSVMGGALGYGR